MTKKRNPSYSDQPTVYQIKLQGHLNRRWTRLFGEVTITHEDDGSTHLTCSVIDQAALYGLLRRIRDLGMPLISITRIRSDATDADDQAGRPVQ